MELNNLKVGQDNFFTMNLTNKSESSEGRYFALTVDPGTSDGLIIERDGVSLKATANPATFFLAYSQNHPVELMVRKTNAANKTMSYPNVEFYFSDACTEGDLFAPNQISTAKVNFNFENPCGTINLVSPADGWSANALQGNLIPIVMGGYTYDNIDSITLEYQKFGTSNWQKGFVVKKANITDPTSFTKNWDIAALPDSIYDIRLRLDCLGGYLLYSQVYTGVIDRQPPAIVGKPQPASGLYQPLSGEISFTFNEPLSSTNLGSKVELRRRSNNSIIPVSVVTVDGKLIITPTQDLGDVVDSFRVIVQNITDMYGNVKITNDTSYFKLDLAPLIAYTGNNVATVHVVNDVQAENSANRIAMHFRLRQKATKVTRIYFNLSGNA